MIANGDMIANGVIRACFGLHFIETNGLWNVKRENIVSYFTSIFLLCHQPRLDFWYTVYQNKKTTEFNFLFRFKSSDLVNDQALCIWFIPLMPGGNERSYVPKQTCG